MCKWDPTITSWERIDLMRYYHTLHRDIRHFVETGTAGGDTCDELANEFDHLYTIEIVPSLYEGSKRRLSKHPNVECLFGDSTAVLPPLLQQIGAPCLFWLDGHFCGSLEARGDKDTPIQEELEIILGTGIPHLILVDDARLFGSDPAYPTVEWVRDFSTSQTIEYRFSYVNDVMRIVPK